jgi:hypothetical protein
MPTSAQTNHASASAIGGNGTPYFFGTGLFSGLSLEYIVVNADAVFDTLLDEDALDILTDLGITTNSIGKGMVIRPRDGKMIESIQLNSGSVTGPE